MLKNYFIITYENKNRKLTRKKLTWNGKKWVSPTNIMTAQEKCGKSGHRLKIMLNLIKIARYNVFE